MHVCVCVYVYVCVCVCTRQVRACSGTHTNQSLISRAPGDVRLECRNFGARSPAVTSLRRCQVGPELRNLCRLPRRFRLPSRLRFLLRAPMLLQQQVPLCSHLLVLRGAKQLGRLRGLLLPGLGLLALTNQRDRLLARVLHFPPHDLVRV